VDSHDEFEGGVVGVERVLGADHPTTLASCRSLATAYESAGRLKEAIPLFERTLSDCERVLGADHPSILTLRNKLADAYRTAGRFDEATRLPGCSQKEKGSGTGAVGEDAR
jgi:hypothetical protein